MGQGQILCQRQILGQGQIWGQGQILGQGSGQGQCVCGCIWLRQMVNVYVCGCIWLRQMSLLREAPPTGLIR